MGEDNNNKTETRKWIIAAFKPELFFCIALFFLAYPVVKAEAYEIGDRQNFLVDPEYDGIIQEDTGKGRDNIDATLKNVGSKSYIYVENDYYADLSDNLRQEFDSYLNSLSRDFDSTIYPKMREVFGDEWNPGIDNDPKITILFVQTKDGIGGYFSPNDEYSKEDIINGRSNEREMIYLNATYLGNERIKSFLAHEFQHMITWYHKAKLRESWDDAWLNEARSEYASTAIGYDDNYPTSNLRARVINFLPESDDSLTEWQNEIYDYSSVNLFSQYLADHYGKTIFKIMIGNEKTGIESINSALKELGYNKDFRGVFSDWIVANYLNDSSSSADHAYGYTNPNLTYQNVHVNLTDRYIISDPSTSIDFSVALKDWSEEYYEFKAREGLYGKKDMLEIDFNGDDSGRFGIPYVIYYKNGTKEVKVLKTDDKQDAKLFVGNFGKDISSVLLIPSSQKQESGFSGELSSYPATLSIKMIQPPVYKKYPTGSLLESIGDQKVYFIENGKRRWITSATAFTAQGYDWKKVTLVTPDELSMIENGEDIFAPASALDGKLVRGSGPKIYLIENGKRRWITSASVFALKKYKWTDVIIIPDTEINSYPAGDDITASNLNTKPGIILVKGTGPKVYLIENGKKRWITTGKVFTSKGYQWKNVEQISDAELNTYPEGTSIK